MRILLTTTSYQDTPGPHHQLLESQGWEIERQRGPLSEERMLELVGDIDGLLCGDDAITASVIDKALPRLKAISKYGIGLDKIDLERATARRLPVLYTPGVNHTTVAEHAFALMLGLLRNLVEEANCVSAGQWKRLTGRELFGKTLGIVGLGRIGKEVAFRAQAFGLDLVGHGRHWDDAFAEERGIVRCSTLEELFRVADIVSLHTSLSPEKRGMVDAALLNRLKDGSYLINCARGELVDNGAVIAALDSGKLAGYGADVLDQEPPPADHPLIRHPKALVTPHIGSRAVESVARQARMATENLARALKGEKPLAQANEF